MLVVWFPQEQFYNSPISIAANSCTAWNSTIYKLVSLWENVLSLCPKSGIFVPQILQIVNLFGILSILYVTWNLIGIKSGLLGRGMGSIHRPRKWAHGTVALHHASAAQYNTSWHVLSFSDAICNVPFCSGH